MPNHEALRWQDDAACAQISPEFFFPEDGDGGSYAIIAKRICAGCPVREMCLEYSQENVIVEGIWGGLSPRKRRILRNERESETAA